MEVWIGMKEREEVSRMKQVQRLSMVGQEESKLSRREVIDS